MGKSPSSPSPQRALLSEPPESLTLLRYWRVASTSSAPSPQIANETRAETMHREHHDPAKIGCTINRTVLTAAAGKMMRPKAITVHGAVRHRYLSPTKLSATSAP